MGVVKDPLGSYAALVAERPELFVNPPGAAYEILLDRREQEAAGGDIGVLYSDPYVILVRDAVRFRNGAVGGYIRVCGAAPGVGAAVLPVLPDGRVVLLRHFRHADRRWYWELPRGFADGDADGAATALRELAEELGHPVVELVRLGAVNTDTGTRVGADEIYLARLGRVTPGDPEPSDARLEGIDEVRTVTAVELAALIAGGEITDGFTLAAYALATARGLLPTAD